MKQHTWTSADKLYLIENYEHLGNNEIGKYIGASAAAVKRMAYDLRLKKSKETISRLCQRSNAGQFKDGQLPHNTRTDHTITTRVDKSGRVISYIRLQLGKWMELHHYNWRQAGNDVPKSHALVFKDGNSQHCEVDNLEVITQAQLLVRNRSKAKAATTKQPAVEQPAKARRVTLAEKRQLSRAAKQELKQRLQEERLAAKEKAFAEKRKAARIAIKPITEQQTKVKRSVSEENQKAKYIAKLATKQRLKDERAVAQQKALAAKREAAAAAAAKLLIETKLEQHHNRITAKEARDIRRARKEKEQRNILPTKPLNLEAKVPFRIDHNTTVYIYPDADREAIRQKYLNRTANF